MRTGGLGKATIRNASRRTAGAVLIGVLVSLCGVVAASAPATGSAKAAGCDPKATRNGDLDGDGRTDLIVGMPGYADGAGAVDVRYTRHRSELLRGADVGASSRKGTRFGASVAIGDMDQDGCADAVIGAPRDSVGPGAGGGRIGRVHIVFGSPTGLRPASAITVDHPASSVDVRDDFGASVTMGWRDTDAGASAKGEVRDLYVGAPGSSVAGHPGAGTVWRYQVTSARAGRVTVGPGRSVTQNSPGVRGIAEAGDRFGQVITPDSYGGLVVSAPMEDVGAAVDAGGIWQFRSDRTEGSPGRWKSSRGFSQSTAGVPGKAESGDHFGAALGSFAVYVAVGVPDEDDGSTENTGGLQMFTTSATGNLRPGRAETQDTAGVPGGSQAGDRFGAAVAVGYDLACFDTFSAAVGAPGDDVGSVEDAGTVTLIEVTRRGRGCGTRTIRQGAGLGGVAEAGDRTGSVLSATRDRSGTIDPESGDRLLVGVPDEDVSADADAGAVEADRPSIQVGGTDRTALTFSGGASRSTRYGSVLSTFPRTSRAG